MPSPSKPRYSSNRSAASARRPAMHQSIAELPPYRQLYDTVVLGKPCSRPIRHSELARNPRLSSSGFVLINRQVEFWVVTEMFETLKSQIVLLLGDRRTAAIL